MKLVIVESPAKAKTIEKYLGGDYKVLSSVGHIRDIPKSASKKANAIDIEKGFVPNYEILENKKKVISALKSEAKKSEEVILAADPDREGEAIAWHVKEVLKLKEGQYSRVSFNEITKDAIIEALKHKRDIDMDLKQAQEARRVLDRLFGYGLSNLIWTKLWYGLSAGRVQSPALRILAEREREIQKFIPEDYFKISVETKNEIGNIINLKYPGDIYDKTEKEKVEKICNQNKDFEVVDIKQTEVLKRPNAPFTTSTLQQTANNYLGFSPSRTMRAAQKLYEKGYITYMRTDSPTLSKKAVSDISFFITDSFGKEMLQNRVFKSKSKNAQEAHEAVRPTDVTKTVLGHTDDEKKLYSLIWKRTVSSQMKDAKTKRTKIIASNSKEIKDFSTTGSVLVFEGWLKVFPEAKGEDQILPQIEKKDILRSLKLNIEEKQTTPPNRYSEAGLVKEMESRGIGRPSTYAAVIKTLKDRNYVTSEGRTLFPTDIGMAVSGFLEKHFENYISDAFTSEMEDELDLLADGKYDYVKLLSDFYDKFTEAVKSKKDIEKITNIGEVEGFDCPECGKKMVWKLSRSGKFMSCSAFPDCTGARNEEGKVLEAPKEIGEACPKCAEDDKVKEEEKGKLVLREGRYGKFISCSRYPKCKFIKEDEETKKANETGVSCTECKDGIMTKKMGRFGEFYACSNYPDCKNAMNAKPTGQKCPICQKLVVEGTKTIPDRCSDKTCPFNRPDRLSESEQKKYGVVLKVNKK
ncbi:DNA topoisomerase I [Candidatus Campbellbacteria bacterium]|nr:MAG: DNA topoisomerase I [Candidatus Campbellbacteria bacterium]